MSSIRIAAEMARGVGAAGPLLATLLALGALGACATAPPPTPAEGPPAPVQTVAEAPAGAVRMVVSNGLRLPLQAARSSAEAHLGRPIVVEYGSSRGLLPTLEGNQPFEVAIVTREVVDDLIAKGKLVAGSRVDLARVLVSIAQRGGSAPVDISTPQALKAALLGARQVRFSEIGASRPTVDNTFDKLAVGEALKPRIRTDSVALTGPLLPLYGGEYELVINLASEFPDTPGWTYLGPLPASLQVPVIISAAEREGGDRNAARALIDYLKSPVLAPALKASRMTR